jgi:hypothetical protein
VFWTSGADIRETRDEDADADVPGITGSVQDAEPPSDAAWFKPLDATRESPIYGDSSFGFEKETRRRECGDPAMDGYAHVNATCLEHSKTFMDAVEGTRDSLVAWYEPHASYDGLAVRWGVGHKKKSARACAAACLALARPLQSPTAARNGGPFSALPCNAFVWCPADVAGGTCFEPDAHAHGAGDCWLKFTEVPESPQVNQRGSNDHEAFLSTRHRSRYRQRHPNAPEKTHWTSGVVLPKGWVPSNGTFGPRAQW